MVRKTLRLTDGNSHTVEDGDPYEAFTNDDVDEIAVTFDRDEHDTDTVLHYWMGYFGGSKKFGLVRADLYGGELLFRRTVEDRVSFEELDERANFVPITYDLCNIGSKYSGVAQLLDRNVAVAAHGTQAGAWSDGMCTMDAESIAEAYDVTVTELAEAVEAAEADDR